MIRILVADDHPVARAGVVGLIDGTDIVVACEAADCGEAVHQAIAHDLEVILLDVRMPGGDGFGTLQKIKQEKPNVSVLMFSVSDSLTEISRAHQLGAAGFIQKGLARDQFLAAIRKAAGGKPAWTRQQLRRVRTSSGNDEPITDHTVSLTSRESEILAKLVQGLVNEDIADELGIDIETVKQHVKHILKKLGVEDRTQAAVWAVRNGLA